MLDEVVDVRDRVSRRRQLPEEVASYVRELIISGAVKPGEFLRMERIAEQVGVSQASIYFWERDHCRPKDGNLAALCRTLNLPIRATRAMAVG